MIVTCEQCTTQFHLDDSKVPEGGIRVRCSRCKHAFLVESPNRSDLDRAEGLARDALDSGSHDDIESDWQFNEEVKPEQSKASDIDSRVAAEAAVDDLLGAGSSRSRGFVGDSEAGFGDPGDSVSDLEPGFGDLGDSAGDLEPDFGDPGDSAGDLEPDFGDPGDSAGVLAAGFGDPGDLAAGIGDSSGSATCLEGDSGDSSGAVGDLEADFAGARDPIADSEPDPAADSHLDALDSVPDLASESELEPPQAGFFEPEPEVTKTEPPAEAGTFEDLGDTGEVDYEEPLSELGAADASPDPAAAPSLPVASAAPSDEPLLEIGDREVWDDGGAAEAAAPTRTAGVAVEHVSSSPQTEAAGTPLVSAPVEKPIDAPPLEADIEAHPANIWVARVRTAFAWAIVSALCLYAGVAGLLLHRPTHPAGEVHWSIAGMDVHAIQGRWIENAVAGHIYVVSGDLQVGPTGSQEPGTLLRVRLVDTAGRPMAAASAAVGPPLSSERLREWTLRDLREEQEKGARRLARTPLRRGERQPFLAVLGDIPPTATGYQITRGE